MPASAKSKAATDSLFLLAAVYWAAEGKPELRKELYNELTTHGTSEADTKSPRIPKQVSLLRQHGIRGLWTCDMRSLESAVAPIYWRAKDDILQIQWDEPLSMAAISHYRENNK